ncbi:MAG TPA: hypothetical protein DCY97_07955 [Marinilabiliales bacterium]|jgi:hypothetical protein|nr:hypothetical protein [Marinilabiliales bacterium]
MFSKNDQIYLKRVIANNQVVLFLGSGFARSAKNKIDEFFPTGQLLGEKLWNFLGYKGKYDQTSLPEMYQAFLAAGIKKQLKTDFLENNLLSGSIPDEFINIAYPFWYKIYTLNIDDILTKIYLKEGKGTKELIFPKDEYGERDQSLEKTQIIYLHGKLPCDPESVIFSTQQYAKSQLAHQPLYSQFVYDYATLPTIFVGTDLNEPLFERYIEAREGKYGFRELRPKSFLITPNLSPVKADNLRNHYNVHHIEGNTKDFLEWIGSIKNELPNRNEILKRTFPNLLKLYEFDSSTRTNKRSLDEFAKAFNRVPRDRGKLLERSGFLLGSSPRWNDIYQELDVPRTLTMEIFNLIEKIFDSKLITDRTKVINIVGYAGSGKSTMLKRLGFTLSQNGRSVFLSYSDYIPRVEEIINVLNLIDERVILLFDNAKNVLSQLPNLFKEINLHLKNPPIIILAIRSNYSDKLNYYLDPEVVDISSFNIPNLYDSEIYNLIAKLDQYNLLGVLKGKSDKERFNEFKYRANRQILIALKEATNGKSFGEIIDNEFRGIEPDEAKKICVCIALNTELGYTNSKQDLVGFSKINHNEALNYLETVLQGTIMWVGIGDRFMLRHKILADHIIRNCISLELLKEGYIRVLSILAPELKKISGPSKKFNLYKSLINHQVLYHRFRGDIEQAREVYDSITEYFKNDSHFWLQYGSLEVEGKGGDLYLAENYLNQAESLSPDNYYIQNAKCNLFYKFAYHQDNILQAKLYKERADTMAQKLLLSAGKEEPHIYHIYCSGRYNFISHWVKGKEQKKSELKELKKSILTAIKLHPRDKKLDIAFQAINRAYLNLGLAESLEDPEIPNFDDL